MQLAFLGLGRMGQGMAARLLGAGHALTVYNRNPQKCDPLVKLGARLALSPREAAQGADIVFSMLADDAALTASMGDDVILAMQEGAVHVSMSTVSTGLTECLAEKCARLGRGFVACPVFGRPDAAAAGTLRLCLAGPKPDKDKVRPYLAPMGELWDFGEKASGSVAIKLAGNFLLISMMEALSEAYSLTEKNGVDPKLFYSFITSTLFAAPAVKLYGQLLLDANFDQVGFAAALGAKDIGLVRAAAKSSLTPMPLAALAEERFLRILAQGWGEKDWSVLGNLQRLDAGTLAEKV